MITVQLKGAEELKKIDVEVYTKNEMKSIVKTIEDDITKNLLNERVVSEDIGGTYGAPLPLSPRYLAWKIRNGKPKNIFRKEQLLIKSVKSKRNSDFNYTIFINGEANDYAEHVNAKRKFFGISKNIIDFIEKSFRSKKVA